MVQRILLTFLTIALSEVSLAIEDTKPLATGRIVGGRQVDIRDFPYQLSLLHDGYHICGASVMSTRFALTAGHCCTGVNVSNLTIRGGSSTNDFGGIVFTVDRLFIHPEYDVRNLNFDVCLLRIVGTFAGKPNIGLIQLGTSGGTLPTGAIGTVSGWGATQTNGNAVRNLRATQVKILTTKECTIQTQNYVNTTESMLCAGNVGSSICVGDSGGPLVYQQRQVGVVSFIINECGGIAPAVYTRLSNKSVRDFITRQINNVQQRRF